MIRAVNPYAFLILPAIFYSPSNQSITGKLPRSGNDVLLLGVGPMPLELPFVKRSRAREKNILASGPPFCQSQPRPLHSDRFEIPHSWHKIENQDVPNCFQWKPAPIFINRQCGWSRIHGGPLLGKLEGRLLQNLLIVPAEGGWPVCLATASSLMHLELGEALSKNGFDILRVIFQGPRTNFSAPVKTGYFLPQTCVGSDQEGRIFSLQPGAKYSPRNLDGGQSLAFAFPSLRLPWWKDAAIL